MGAKNPESLCIVKITLLVCIYSCLVYNIGYIECIYCIINRYRILITIIITPEEPELTGGHPLNHTFSLFKHIHYGGYQGEDS